MEDISSLSEVLLLAVKKEASYQKLVKEIDDLHPEILSSLNTDTKKIAFWLNIYNAFYQIIAKENPGIGKAIYKEKVIIIAGSAFSLDDIEHGILRRGRYKYSLGYLGTFTNKFNHLQPSTIDFRIHFALNCGAKSCPPIAFYSTVNLYDQLEVSTQSFLASEISIDEEGKTITISKLFLWFRKDFGGRRGIHKIFKKYLKIDTNRFKIKYSDYDWTEALGNFR